MAASEHRSAELATEASEAMAPDARASKNAVAIHLDNGVTALYNSAQALARRRRLRDAVKLKLRFWFARGWGVLRLSLGEPL